MLPSSCHQIEEEVHSDAAAAVVSTSEHLQFIEAHYYSTIVVSV